ncbi:MAG TPA: stage II sporulation protein M [Opitutaceae bacterium]|nr:stage II sporulation protein M [Opitutaceae bacterium]
MIVNLDRFIKEEQPRWDRLDGLLRQMAADPWRQLPLEEAQELERLYQRAAADLARIATFTAEPEVRRRLESLVARGHAEIHGGHAEAGRRFRPGEWLARTLPQTWRRQAKAFWFAFALMVAGAAFGGCAIAFDPGAKAVLMPFSHLRESPTERVAREIRDRGKKLSDSKASFSGMLMTHNTRVTLTAMALGMTAGIGTFVLMFYNGVILGAVALDYILDGQTTFLLGWLMPHGVIELPAMLVGGQAGFVLAGALLGRGRRENLAARMRAAAPDVVTLCFGASLMLVWAGIVEAFLSQYHEPVIPYAAKIAFGTFEFVALVWYASRAGKTRKRDVRP